MPTTPTTESLIIEDKDRPTYRPRMSYYLWGNLNNGKKNLLCLHGLSRNGADFDFLARKLTDQYNIICPDIVGRGKSDWLENKSLYGYKTYILDIVSFLRQLNLKNVDVVGTSMGGLIAMVIATKFKQDSFFDKIVLNDIGPVIPASYLRDIYNIVSAPINFTTLEEAQQSLHKRLEDSKITLNEHWQHIYDCTIVKDNNGKFSLAYDPAITKRPKFWQLFFDIGIWKFWKNVSNPILSIRGSESKFFLKKTQDKLKKRLPHIDHVTFEGIGHAPTLLEDSQIAVIKEWLLR